MHGNMSNRPERKARKKAKIKIRMKSLPMQSKSLIQ
jgi:hypothetical protein